MKPKEIIKQSMIENGINAKNQDGFLINMLMELKHAYQDFAQDDSEQHFNAAIKVVRSKWDAISNKIPYGLSDDLWAYFYTKAMKLKKQYCPTWAKKQEEEHQKYLQRQERRAEKEEARKAAAKKDLDDALLFAAVLFNR